MGFSAIPKRIVREPENCLDLIFVPSPCEKVVIVSHLQLEDSCWTCQVLVASKTETFKSEPKELRTCEPMWFKFVRN